jgi:hypothetical protein
MNTWINSYRVMFSPKTGWQQVAAQEASSGRILLTHTLPMALIPTSCWYLGVTTQGWTLMGDPVKLTPDSALILCSLFYLAMIGAVLFLGSMVTWMADTYNAEHRSLNRGISLISYTATPFFLAGLLGLYPVLWLDILIGTAVACYCIYLLFLGTGAVMRVPPERSFLYAAALFAVALVAFVALLGATVIIWDFGAPPEYTY